MVKKNYTKQALTLDQQIQFLSDQGLIIDNHSMAKQVISRIGYYRFSGYLLPSKLPHNSHGSRKFKPNITFEQIWQLYQFDRELKLLVTDAIEKIEIAFRASIINDTALTYGPFWYVDQQYYRHIPSYERLMMNFQKINEKYHDRLIKCNRKFFAIAYIILELLKEISPDSRWEEKLFELFAKYEKYPNVEMGFQHDWKADPFWTI